ncbi:MAG: SGNH/GDSL hydrolase family protein [Ruminococcaceae bacterium]|nr:SGNH/GDSL hydrolase family protein [Oscillospiraceae bacterium]
MKKKFISCFCILLVTALLLGFLQALLQPKYMSENKEGALISEYYAEEGRSHDVLFIGDCEVYEGFTPPTLWEEYGITSYVRGSAQQLTWHSYYLLEEMLKTETPRVVVFNVLALKYGEPQNEAYNRIALDGMHLSFTKLRAVFASMTEEENWVSYVFPILRYHSRWKELSAEDWKYLCSRDLVSHNGYLMQTGIKPGFSDMEPSPLADYTLPERSMYYLDAMRQLCLEKGVAFVLIKAPTNNWKYYWYDEWDEQVADYAARYGISYYNFIPQCEEIGIDWNTDTYDGGTHLNVWGAEKLTSYFGAILAEDFGLAGHHSDAELASVWSEKLAAYKAERDAEP